MVDTGLLQTRGQLTASSAFHTLARRRGNPS